MVVALEGGDQAAPPSPRTLDQSQAAAMIQVNRAAPTRVEARSPRILYTKCTLQLPVKGVNTTSTVASAITVMTIAVATDSTQPVGYRVGCIDLVSSPQGNPL